MTGAPDLFAKYLATQPQQYRKCLAGIRELILSIIPQAEETFSYQAHCFKYIYMLVGIGTNKNFCSLYTMSSTFVKTIQDELKPYKVSGMTIHFNPDEPLPTELITMIVLGRIKENELLALARKKK